MAVRIPDKGPDKRVEQILRDPAGYFQNARDTARAQVKAERERQRGKWRRRPA